MISKSKIKVVATFLTISGAHMNSLFIVQVKILVFIIWSHMTPNPQSCPSLSLKRLLYFEHAVLSL